MKFPPLKWQHARVSLSNKHLSVEKPNDYFDSAEFNKSILMLVDDGNIIKNHKFSLNAADHPEFYHSAFIFGLIIGTSRRNVVILDC